MNGMSTSGKQGLELIEIAEQQTREACKSRVWVTSGRLYDRHPLASPCAFWRLTDGLKFFSLDVSFFLTQVVTFFVASVVTEPERMKLPPPPPHVGASAYQCPDDP